jgi:phage protein D
MGLFTADEIGHSGPPAALTIRAKAANMRNSMKSRKTRSWDNTTFGKIVEKIAAEHGYTAKISPELASSPIIHIDQAEESDIHLLSRMAKERDAVFKPTAGHFIMAPRGEGKSTSGKPLIAVNIDGKQVSHWSMNAASRGKYSAVTANWYSPNRAELVPVTVGQGEPVLTLPKPFFNHKEAHAAAKGKMAALDRGTATLDLTVIGNAALSAEAKLFLSGVSSKVNGNWVVTRVNHKLDGQGGYTCNISAETPKGDPKPILD